MKHSPYITAVTQPRFKCAESPHWDEKRDALVFVDIPEGKVWALRHDGTLDMLAVMSQPTGSVVPREGGGFVIAACDGLYMFEVGETIPSKYIPLEADLLGNRFNDAKCDPQGRLWAGSIDGAEKAVTGSLYRLDWAGRIDRHVEDIFMSNGLDWSLDHRSFYFVDSFRRSIDRYTFEPLSGQLSNRERFLDVPENWGYADGLWIDGDDGIWVAFWEGGCLRRFRPDGSVERVVDLPAALVTSCCANPEGQLFVTTALPDANDAERPLGGAILMVDAGVPYRPVSCFKG